MESVVVPVVLETAMDLAGDHLATVDLTIKRYHSTANQVREYWPRRPKIAKT